jgi:hypothetical protein
MANATISGSRSSSMSIADCPEENAMRIGWPVIFSVLCQTAKPPFSGRL